MVESDLEAVSALCISAFMTAVAPSLSPQGVAPFTQIAAADSFAKRMAGDNLMLVFVQENQVLGVIELKEGRHVAMLFVDPQQQSRGVGRQLVAAALAHARSEVVTVSASLTSVAAYERYGFNRAGEIGEYDGLVYQPMTITLSG
ncbi:GNAT family N-acetyltransferase [Ectopseudomonas mendocina]|uniref:GNAT family N-acetyltransferase n=1 Tax=Ectopseudomonas mendocina TaxID=300 RepID=A0A2R3QWR8_ECTME|nr:GNAT family N-acetyltransferase [Pseudomonas mendocina]